MRHSAVLLIGGNVDAPLMTFPDEVLVFLPAHMWFNSEIYEADTSEDQTGESFDKVACYYMTCDEPLSVIGCAC